ncbi:MAG: ABC transporter substrate-binding protein [Xanthobacteraceae bacterium]
MKLSTTLLAAALTSLGGAALAQNTIKIGNIVVTAGPLKGPGEPSVTAVDLAVEQINAAGGIAGKKIELFRFDTGSDPKQASIGARKLMQDDKVLAVVGPFSSGETAVAVNDAERLKVLMMPTSASAPGLTDGRKYVWRLSEDEYKQFSRLLKSIKSKGIKSDTAEIVYISDEVISNNAGTKLYPPLLASANIKHGEPIAVQYKSFDMSAQAARILAANPDLVAVAALPESASKVIKELRRQGYKGRIIGSQLFADPNVLELFGPEGNGTLLVAGFWKGHNVASQSFNDRLVAELKNRGIHKLGAHHVDAQAFDTVFLLKQVMESVGVTADPAKLTQEREALVAAMHGVRFSGVLGDNICFAGNDAELPGYIIEIKDGEWNKFDEAPADPCN